MADAPELAYHQGGLEVCTSPGLYELPIYQKPTLWNKASLASKGDKEDYDSNAKPRLIFGLHQQTFWFLFILAAIILVVAVGGGVGGVLTARSKSKSSSTPVTTSDTAILPSWISTSISSPTSTAPFASTQTALSATTRTPVTPTAGTVSNIRAFCPSKNFFDSSLKFQFRCTDKQKFDGSDLSALTVYTVQECVEACITYNKHLSKSGDRNCVAATIGSDLVDLSRVDEPPVCWLKWNASGPATNDFSTSLELCRTEACD